MSGTNTRVLMIVYFIPPHIIVNFAGTLQGLLYANAHGHLYSTH